MPLAPVVLDNLTWAEIVSASLQRIPADSSGRWTLHAPVDPGVTLIELYAWLFDQRSYWIDQVPDGLTRALLTLLGITPEPAQAATTLLHLRALGGAAVALKAGTKATLHKGLSPPAFSTIEVVTAYPQIDTQTGRAPARPKIGLRVGSADRTDDLSQGRSPALLADGAVTTITLPLDPAALAKAAGGWLGLFFDLKVAPGIDPAWLAGGVEIDPPGALTWSYSTAGGTTPFATGSVDDGTDGLRRPGVVRLMVPADWVPAAGPPAGLAVTLESASASRPYPPRLNRLVPNVVTIEHKVDYKSSDSGDGPSLAKQVAQWTRLPGNVLILPAGARPPFAETVVLTLDERSGPAQKWTSVPDLTPFGPDARVFVVDVASGRLRFGDGRNGRLPVPAAAGSVTLSASVGGGSAGNLGGGLTWDIDGIDLVEGRNVVPAEGGSDPETLAGARQRASSELRRPGRAVTQSDFETIARTTPEAAIARAHAAIGRHPSYPGRTVPGSVTVFIVPDLPRDADGSPDPGVTGDFPPPPEPDPQVVAAVQARLDAARLITTEVYVCPPNYRPVALAVTIVAHTFDPDATRSAVKEALRNYLDPLIGGEGSDGWPFGGTLRPSTLLKVAQDGLGESGTVSLVTVQLQDVEMDPEGCVDVAIGPDDLVELVRVDVRLSRPVAGRGGLR